MFYFLQVPEKPFQPKLKQKLKASHITNFFLSSDLVASWVTGHTPGLRKSARLDDDELESRWVILSSYKTSKCVFTTWSAHK